jgi:hypothetical protein
MAKIAKQKTLEDLEGENKTLRTELDDIKKMLFDLKSAEDKRVIAAAKVQKTESKAVDAHDPTIFSTKIQPAFIEEEYQVDVPFNKYIKVMSLTNHTLVLSTEGNGQGKAFVFNKFGQTKDIMYGELREVIHNQESFVKNGKFYILNKDVVKNHDLIEDYKKILTKSMIENIMNFDIKEIQEFFKGACKSQQETIVSIIIGKLKSGEDIDMNKLNVINKLCGKNLQDIAHPTIIDDDE